jgi:hypothetical protein
MLIAIGGMSPIAVIDALAPAIEILLGLAWVVGVAHRLLKRSLLHLGEFALLKDRRARTASARRSCPAMPFKPRQSSW